MQTSQLRTSGIGRPCIASVRILYRSKTKSARNNNVWGEGGSGGMLRCMYTSPTTNPSGIQQLELKAISQNSAAVRNIVILTQQHR